MNEGYYVDGIGTSWKFMREAALDYGVIASQFDMLGEQEIGDATELALLHMGKELGYDRERLLQQYPRTFEIPFDSEKKIYGKRTQNGRL